MDSENYAIYGKIDQETGKLIATGSKKEMDDLGRIAQEKYNIRVNHEIIKDIIKKYLDMKEEYYNLIALWIIGTYLHDGFESYPYLFFNAMRGSGKSRALKLISSLSKDGIYSMSPTESTLFRTHGTLCLDEIESIGSKEKQTIREILNASYKKGISIMRTKKGSSKNGEEFVVENFEPYRPICMANIWGMEEVLGDRSITLILEKSNHPVKTRLAEDFENNRQINEIKGNFGILLENQCSYLETTPTSKYPNLGTLSPINPKCSLCSVVMKKNIYSAWNEYLLDRYTLTTLYTYTTQTTQTTPNTQEIIKYDDLFNKIHDSEIKGRNLELFLPLFFIADIISSEVFNETLEFAKELTKEKSHNEETESLDVLVYEFIASRSAMEMYSIKDLVRTFREFSDESSEWLNVKWFGRALKRLNLIAEKRRKGHGIEVTLNILKAREKSDMFKNKLTK